VGGLSSHTTRCPSVEKALVGKTLGEAQLTAASQAATADLGDDIMGDIHASADYRKAMLAVYLQRALTKAAGRI
jgi:carbon-monoxide dehydrogenase medium subunit